MLKERKFFKFFWKVVEFFGVFHHKLTLKQKIRAIFIFVTLAGTNFVLALIAFYVYDDIDSRINGLQTFPFFLQMLLDGIHLAIKSKEIENLFYKLDNALEKIKDEKNFWKDYKIFRRYAIFGASSGIFLVTFSVLLMLFTGKQSVIIYIPPDNELFFFLFWLLQSIFFYYSALLNYLFDAFMNGMLIILNTYVKSMRIRIRSKNISKMKDVLELDLELRSFLKSFEKSYSIVILFRGFVAIISLSSLMLDLINKFSNETGSLISFAMNVLFRFFMPSYYGNEIKYNYAELLNDFYNYNWIDASIKERKNFILIQTNLSKNYQLVAAKIFPINLNTFLKIIESAYSFYAVLNRVRN